MLACQIKCGPSFFRDSNRWGYVYRGENKHFNYLANYPLPVIIIICDPDSGEACWVRFLAADAQITEGGWKVTIPSGNKLSSSKAELESLLPTVTDHLSLLGEYWRVNNMLFEFEHFLFMIEREEVENGDVSRVNEFRARLCSAKEMALHCQGKIEFSFSGYDTDPRELYEIEEVKRYVALLDGAFPELFFFARTAEPATTLKLFIISLFGVGRESPAPRAKVVIDLRQMGPFLKGHFESLNLISEWVGLPHEEIRRISEAVLKPLGYPPDSTATDRS